MPTTNPIVMCVVVGVALDEPQAASNTPKVAAHAAALKVVVHLIAGHSSKTISHRLGPIAHPEP
jgi:tRNA(Leu) C34 or U34 (ribose-2'-O)-methylase TrmL